MSGLPSYFVNTSSGSLVRVREVDTSYAYLEVLAPQPAAYAMPLDDYDRVFVSMFRPATEADLRALTGKNFRLPSNAPAGWAEPADETR